ncbi:PREDICTED: 3-hydroxy-3-methylglutaryl-coenzyme A reductase isoform X2 [Trachymyrmex cornetzi]|nr:PREDICTED: 3-hydroxy-3-methylglutaryl-coenzyme A reductase isoform X2 [Trachymyrmex cornetzi]XP_018366450.1 PREDICTED: 3-hydroxy-3-methylglutaryl-coenzyme A reductase isoform X2 [Trachymyrmex cornetzi]XP_018366451.1 PREDICTED: 3-hydroxy-3-methylglutaryl-coenzyme A reductase isoform X2 [Trachymyrmex cornetzi]XP_018366452.1 PREDICTED: 3-hydroxy-3-methylglutaryl-coenzyme A reductase isoform X2 [Trachymyrmex cornetzi]
MMFAHVFEKHGRFCAGYPFEVIVTIFTLTACMLNMDTGSGQAREENLSDATYCRHNRCDTMNLKSADVIVMTIIRCLAVLFTYHHFRNLQKMGSKYILGIAGLFTVFSSVVFTSSVVNFSRSDVADLKDALFFFLLLIDLTKAATLAQYALSSRNQEEVKANIARGMSLLGPGITLNTLVETLVIGTGALSGIRRLEILCTFACFGVIVNYVVFMTFYPACLSLILELSRGNNNMGQLSADKIFIMQPLNEEDQKPNPVVERVKMIMIAGLFVVYANSRWPFKNESEVMTKTTMTYTSSNATNDSDTGNSELNKHLMTPWLSASADNIVILILLLALAVKFIFFEDRNDVVVRQLRCKEEEEEEEERKGEEEEKEEATVEEKMELLDGSNLNDMDTTVNIWLRDRFGLTLPTIQEQPVFPLSGVGGGWGDESDVEYADKEIQTELIYRDANDSGEIDSLLKKSEISRSVEDCLEIYKSELGASALTNEEVIQLVKHKNIAAYQLEKAVGDMERGVDIRRLVVGDAGKFTEEMIDLPYKHYDYSKVLGACCENVIGYVPVPVGIVGPLLIDGQVYHVPMATTEGCLVASTNRGSRALLKCGVTTRVTADGMTRAPVVQFPDIVRACEAMSWIEQPQNFEELKNSFDQTSRFARLKKIHPRIAGRDLHLRFVATTGDAMGMNMLSKGTERSLQTLQTYFPDMEIISLSGNLCTDKKPAAVNWIEGRGKSVVCEAIVPAGVVTCVLKTSVHELVKLNNKKNLTGSALAGSIGGFNAHAANIVTAIFIATGQDPAQNVSSSNCLTLMEPWGVDGKDLRITCTMPSIEVGTVGGGTGLPAQGACLAMLGIKGAHPTEPGQNARKLSRIVCATVLAAELSLMAALASGDLVKSHLRHNRSSVLISNSVHTTHGSTDGNRLTVPNVLPF